MQASPGVVTFLFTDIEGSSLLWERDPERMPQALAHHDALVRAKVGENRGRVVKMLGDGVHAVFDDPRDAVDTAVKMLQALADPASTNGIGFRVRCGMHAGIEEHRDNDFFGRAVNRAARIMAVAHGGQILVSHTVASLIGERLPVGVTLRDLGSVRLRDLASPERVCQVLHRRLQAEFPALRTLESTPNNLPQQLTSFIGREREQVDVAALLASSPLLTLLGAGGIGKTRLSLQVAADVMDGFPDGVWLVELAALADPGLVPQAVASALGVREEAGRPVQEALVRFVKDRRLLVILDNCEHLVQACAELAKQLLQSGSRMKFLASSREPLRVAGESTYAVPALAFPGLSRMITPAALTEYEAVRLFIDRAVAAQSTFQVTEQNATALAGICHQLDGIPLAIELAAARTRVLSVENIAARLDDRFRLLKGGDKTALPRQQTLRALIDWSFDLLTEPERILLRRLAVFAGGFTLEAVESVGAGGEIESPDVLQALTNLVEKSLVVLGLDGRRYHLLETVRQYAQERLAESEEAAATRDRHLAFFAALAVQSRPGLIGPQQAQWLARLDAERENLLAANAWCDRADGGAEVALRMLNSVKHYLFSRGFLALGRRLMVEALARAGAQKRDIPRCEGYLCVGQIDCWMGRYADALAHLEEGLAIAREIDDKLMVAALLQPLGLAALGNGNPGAARAYLAEALALARVLGDKREILAAQTALALLHRADGELDAAEPLYEGTLTLARELGDRESIAICLLNLAMVSIGQGSSDRPSGMLLEVLDIVDETGSQAAGQSVLEVAAGLAARRAQWMQAARLYGAAEAQAGRTGLHRDSADEAFLAPLIEMTRRALSETDYVATEAAGRALGYGEALLEARAWLRTSG
ncbi:MAG: tetratricopeptide repeat protein [Casimicrobiaceae bacterium]